MKTDHFWFWVIAFTIAVAALFWAGTTNKTAYQSHEPRPTFPTMEKK